jgi:phospholipid/cholesterol/gamma-HCH transport system substrate-binding protein
MSLLSKVSNETKVGVLAAVAITMLILGFYYLKGRNLFDKRVKIYARFTKVDGLAISNPVNANGLEIGTVYEIMPADKDLNSIMVTINLHKDVNLSKSSLASITGSLLGTATINIQLGKGAPYLGNGDTLLTNISMGMLDEVKQTLNPVLDKVKSSLDSVTMLLGEVSRIFDPNAKNNIRSIIANVNGVTANLVTSSQSLNNLLNSETGALAKSMNNVNAFTGNLAKNNEKMNEMIDNLNKTTANLSKADIEGMMNKLNLTVSELKTTMDKINSGEGSLGLLLNDKALYRNLEASTRSLNILLDDFRVHPKRYVSISVFGKKEKGGALMAPLPFTDSLNPKKGQ